MKFPRNARMLRSQLDAAPFAAVFFLLVIFMMLGSLIYTPGARLELQLPQAEACRARISRRSRWPLMPMAGCITKTSGSRRSALRGRLQEVARKSPEPLTLVVQADKAVSYERLMRLTLLAREAGIPEALLATLPGPLAHSPP